MNILFTPSDNNVDHGAFLSMVKLASILQEKYGHQILVVLPYEGKGKELLEKNNIRSVLAPSFDWLVPLSKRNEPKTVARAIKRRILNLKPIAQIAKIIKDEKIDIVHINTSWTYVGAVAALRCKTPFIWHIREFLEEDQKLCIWQKWSGIRLMNKANYVVTISNSLFKKYKPLINPKKLRMIPNGIDPSSFLCREHEIFELDPYRFAIVGNLSEGKGQEELIRACIKLHEEGIDCFKLTVAGNDKTEYAEKLKAMVEQNKIRNIEFVGVVSNPEKLFQSADITFMCSKSEAFGRVTVEAMMAGSLVIGARCAGTLDIIEDGESGFLYTPGNIEELVDKIKYCINHPNEARKMAKNGQNTALKKFTAEKNAEAVNELYSEIISNSRIGANI